MSDQQQRQFHRAGVELPVEYFVDGRRGSASAKVSDLGGGGLRLATSEHIPSGTIVTLQFRLSQNDREPINARGKVVLSYFNAIEKVYGHGVAFTQIAPPDQERVVEFIADLQRAQIKNRA